MNRDEYDPTFPERYEYLELDQWSLDEWAPRKLDIVMEIGEAKDYLSAVTAARTTLSMRVGSLMADPKTELTDIRRLEASAVWLPAQYVQTIEFQGTQDTNRVVLIRGFDLGHVCEDLSKRNLWPIELRIEVVLEPLRAGRLKEAIMTRSLKVIPGD